MLLRECCRETDHGTGWEHFSDEQGCTLVEGIHCLVNSHRLSRMCLRKSKASGKHMDVWSGVNLQSTGCYQQRKGF